MSELVEAKNIIRKLHASFEHGGIDDYRATLMSLSGADYLWRGYHPFNEIQGAQNVVETFYRPLASSLTNITRRADIFFAGENQFEPGEIWVCSMGHLLGLFDKAWLGIRPTNRLTMLRYCEFNKISGGTIAETAMYFDIPHLMCQAGQNPFPPQTGAQLVQPGPAPHDGLLFEDQPAEEGQKTLNVINQMVSNLGQWQNKLPLIEELAQTWHGNMLWWGPTGIGATYTIERYARQHASIFREAFSNRSKTNHVCRIGEGSFGGFFGWPNFTAVHQGGFMGLPGSDKHLEFRVIDIYQREGEKLAENWVFIDMLHIMKQMGVDILARNQTL